MANPSDESSDPQPPGERPALPDDIVACLFDLDGVVTSTAKLHAAAWKQTLDEFLATRTDGDNKPFDIATDYREYIDGRLREDGVRAFLASRHIELPKGAHGDAPGSPTVQGIAKAKNDRLLAAIERDGVEVFDGSVKFIRFVRERHIATALVSASANAMAVLRAAKLTELFDVVVDGRVAALQSLAGKPAPDTFLAAADELGIEPVHAAVFEDAVAGVEAGHAGGFGFVVGVVRNDNADELRDHGADVAVEDLALLIAR
jgi:beta-phosphoglucomutase family hydrolase